MSNFESSLDRSVDFYTFSTTDIQLGNSAKSI